jgi:hypothetical protein
MEEPTPAEVVHDAIDTLMTVVAQAAVDLRAFHDVVERSRRSAPFPPLPRSTVLLTEGIVERLERVDEDLRKLLFALGLSEPAAKPSSDTPR